MKEILLVKLGGSLITDKKIPFKEDLEVIKHLVGEIHRARRSKGALVVVGHGGGSYPHVPAMKYKTAEGVINERSYKGIAEVQDAAARLNRIVVRQLIEFGENAVSLSPSSFMVSQNGEVKEAFLRPLFMLLRFKMLPVVYGDVVLDVERGCSILSTEKVLNFLAEQLKESFKVGRVVHCGRTDGVYDTIGETVPQIDNKNFESLKKNLGGSEGIDVTGGMLHKVEESLSLARRGTFSVIINGTKSGELYNALVGKSHGGTEIRYKP